MRAAVISDVHGNLAALEAVCAAIDAEAPDAVWCLGDLVGYGPRPNECCAIVRGRADVCLVGNHDLVALDSADVSVDEFNHDAAAAARWTQDALSADSRAFLESLEPERALPEALLVHASPRDPIWEYVLTAESAAGAFLAADARLILVGHSHVALQLSFDGSALEGGQAQAGTEVELDGPRRLLNPGSVGQPRDGDPRAAWLLVDFDRGRASFRRVEYDVERTQAEIRAAGLPHALADRLRHGI